MRATTQALLWSLGVLCSFTVIIGETTAAEPTVNAKLLSHCPDCEVFKHALQQLVPLHFPAAKGAEDAKLAADRHLCLRLSPALRAPCDKIVTVYGLDLVDHLIHHTPAALCEQIISCYEAVHAAVTSTEREKKVEAEKQKLAEERRRHQLVEARDRAEAERDKAERERDAAWEEIDHLRKATLEARASGAAGSPSMSRGVHASSVDDSAVQVELDDGESHRQVKLRVKASESDTRKSDHDDEDAFLDTHASSDDEDREEDESDKSHDGESFAEDRAEIQQRGHADKHSTANV